MDKFIDMTINDLLTLQKELKEIKTYKRKIKHIDANELFKKNWYFFNDIACDIDDKFEKLLEEF